jgi:hypothetical protein
MIKLHFYHILVINIMFLCIFSKNSYCDFATPEQK